MSYQPLLMFANGGIVYSELPADTKYIKIDSGSYLNQIMVYDEAESNTSEDITLEYTITTGSLDYSYIVQEYIEKEDNPGYYLDVSATIPQNDRSLAAIEIEFAFHDSKFSQNFHVLAKIPEGYVRINEFFKEGEGYAEILFLLPTGTSEIRVVSCNNQADFDLKMYPNATITNFSKYLTKYEGNGLSLSGTRDAMPADYPIILKRFTINSEEDLTGWSGHGYVLKDGNVSISSQGELISPVFNISDAVRPALLGNCKEVEVSSDGINYTSYSTTGKDEGWRYMLIPPSIKYIRWCNKVAYSSSKSVSVDLFLLELDGADTTPIDDLQTKRGLIHNGLFYESDALPFYNSDIKKDQHLKLTSGVFGKTFSRLYLSDIKRISEVIAIANGEKIRLTPYNPNYYLVPAKTSEIYLIAAEDKTVSSVKVYDDLASINSELTDVPTTIPTDAASWYDINADGKWDMVSDCKLWISTDEGYQSISFNSTYYDKHYLINAGGNNGILCYNDQVFKYDPATMSLWSIYGDPSDKYAYYPVDTDNDGRSDLLPLPGSDGKSAPKVVVSLNHSGSLATGKLDIMTMNDYLSLPEQHLSFTNPMGGDWFVPSPPPLKTSAGTTLESHDLNNDGWPDLVDFINSKIYYNVGKNRFATTDFGGQILLRDFNGDGIEDYIIYDSDSKTITSYMVNADGTLTEKQLISGFYCGKKIWAADVDKDGKVDLVLPIGTYSTSTSIIVILKNKGDGTFKKYESPLPTSSSYIALELNDIDNDGRYDLLVSGGSKTSAYPIENCKLASTPTTLVEKSSSSANLLPSLTNPDCKVLYDSERKLADIPMHSNSLPTRPAKPEIVYEASTGLVKICWQATTDAETPAADLTYALRIGTAPDLDDIVTADALADGRRRNITGGNMGHSLMRVFDASSWPDGKCYISVQAVDGANGGSQFSEYAVLDKKEPANSFTLSYKKPFGTDNTCVVSLNTTPVADYTYKWDFADAVVLTADEAQQRYELKFPTAGDKEITLSVSTADGYTAPLSSQIISVQGISLSQSDLIYKYNGNYFDFTRIYFAADIDEDGTDEVYYSDFRESILEGVYGSISRMFNSHEAIGWLDSSAAVDINSDGHVDFFGKGNNTGVAAINQEDKDLEISTGWFAGDNDGWFVDLNNDGKLDYIARVSGYNRIAVYSNDGDYKSFTEMTPLSDVSIVESNNTPLLKDYTGDGLVDFIGRTRNDVDDTYTYAIYENQGDFTFKALEPIYRGELWSKYFGDFDNNGKLDVLLPRYDDSNGTCELSIIWDDGQTDLIFNDYGGAVKSFYGTQVYSSVYTSLDLDNNGYPDIFGPLSEARQKSESIQGYVAYTMPGRKFIVKKIEAEDYSNFNLEGVPFIASNGGRYLAAGNKESARLRTPNTRPMAPDGLRHSQNDDGVVIEWNPSADKETPASLMRYNLSIKRKGVDGEGAYLISPCNGGKNGVSVPTNKDLQNSPRIRIPAGSIPAGEYEVKVQGVDLMHDASDFSETYVMKVAESCNIDLPTTTEVGYKTTVKIAATVTHDLDWDGGEVVSESAGIYSVVWHEPGCKTVTVGNETAVTYVNEAPTASFTIPDKVNKGDRIIIPGVRMNEGQWQLRLASSPAYKWMDINSETARTYAEFEYLDEETCAITFVFGKLFELKHTVSSDYSTATHEATVSIGTLNAPEIGLVDIDGTTGKHRLTWTVSDIPAGAESLNIYKETSIADNYKLIANVAIDATSYVDLTSTPEAKASRYRMSYVLPYGESANGTPHQAMHAMINRGMNDNTWNLIWTAYEGRTIDTYRILRGTSPDNLQMIDEVSGNMTSYCDTNAPDGPLFYAIEIIPTNSVEHARKAIESKSMPQSSRSNVVSTADGKNVFLVEKIEIINLSEDDEISMPEETTINLRAVVSPINATIVKVRWAILTGENLATVDDRGVVTATGFDNGSVTVAACAIDGSGVLGEYTIMISGVDLSAIPNITDEHFDMKVSPSPAVNEVHITGIPCDETAAADLYIFGMDGALRFTKRTTTTDMTVDCSSYTSGIYIVKAVSQRGCATARFIKK